MRGPSDDLRITFGSDFGDGEIEDMLDVLDEQGFRTENFEIVRGGDGE